jgi:uncharacterized Zn ribbon protein
MQKQKETVKGEGTVLKNGTSARRGSFFDENGTFQTEVWKTACLNAVGKHINPDETDWFQDFFCPVCNKAGLYVMRGVPQAICCTDCTKKERANLAKEQDFQNTIPPEQLAQ